ncbi:MAG: alpha-ketoacid dehydrogenase subunit beta, partial [Bacteroidetes bacterium]|nr:alpha-ketoacid dehydrogenase subunit beta [Bacteroidota bacterium]
CTELAKEGIDAEMIDLRCLRPIDYDTVIESVKKTNRCVVVEESWPLASMSSEIAYIIQKRAFDFMDAPVVRVTGRDTPLPYSSTLVDTFLPNAQRTIEAVKQVMYR